MTAKPKPLDLSDMDILIRDVVTSNLALPLLVFSTPKDNRTTFLEYKAVAWEQRKSRFAPKEKTNG